VDGDVEDEDEDEDDGDGDGAFDDGGDREGDTPLVAREARDRKI
jgi:hypothetical protein